MRHRIAAWELTFVTAAGRSGRDRTSRALGQSLDRSCTLRGIMRVSFAHLRPSGHIMPDHAGDRGAVFLVLAPHDHLHINQIRAFPEWSPACTCASLGVAVSAMCANSKDVAAGAEPP